MPCNCDYMNANELEKELSQVACILDEVKLGKEIDKNHWEGYHPSVYQKPLTKKQADAMVEELCAILQKKNIKKFSLEAQVWWRDHQIADKKRIENELQSLKEKKARALALHKLSQYERKLLGV